MIEENTHSMCIAGAASSATGDALLGTITLPADGPWLIHTVWGQMVSATATAGEAVGGSIRIEAAQGDIDPNPAPARFPFYVSGSNLGATIDEAAVPLNFYPVEWNAPGRATLNIWINNVVATTVAPQAVVGIIFGKTRPENKPIVYCDNVRGTVTVATDLAVGTLTLSERATSITGVCGVLLRDNVAVAGEELIGFWRMASDDVNVVPAQFPFNNAFSAGLGALINAGTIGRLKFLPVDIPIVGGARINTFVDLNTAVTNAAEVSIFIAYQ